MEKLTKVSKTIYQTNCDCHPGSISYWKSTEIKYYHLGDLLSQGMVHQQKRSHSS